MGVCKHLKKYKWNQNGTGHNRSLKHLILVFDIGNSVHLKKPQRQFMLTLTNRTTDNEN